MARRGRWSALTIISILLQFILIAILIDYVWFWSEDQKRKIWKLELCSPLTYICYDISIDLAIARILLAIYTNAICSVLLEWLVEDKTLLGISLSVARSFKIYEILFGNFFDFCPLNEEEDVFECELTRVIFVCQVRFLISILLQTFIVKSLPYLRHLNSTILAMNRHQNGRFSAFTVVSMIIQIALFGTLAYNLAIWYGQTDAENLKTFQYITIDSLNLQFNATFVEIIAFIYVSMLLSLLLTYIVRFGYLIYCVYLMIGISLALYTHEEENPDLCSNVFECTTHGRLFFVYVAFVGISVIFQLCIWNIQWFSVQIPIFYGYLNSMVPIQKRIKVSARFSKEDQYFTRKAIRKEHEL